MCKIDLGIQYLRHLLFEVPLDRFSIHLCTVSLSPFLFVFLSPTCFCLSQSLVSAIRGRN